MTTPTTAAGRALVAAYASPENGRSIVMETVLACEAEARAAGRAAALDEAWAAVRNVRRSRLVGPPANRHLESGPEGHLLDLTEVLAAIDALRERFDPPLVNWTRHGFTCGECSWGRDRERTWDEWQRHLRANHAGHSHE